jgi:uncharacterized membrane protein YciS (DUF1049 family)
LLRKILTVIVVVPIALILIAFAVANRQEVVVSFDPFDLAQPAYSKTTWLFVPIFLALIIGVLIGGAATWLRHGRWRWMARRLEVELRKLRVKVAAMEGGQGPSVPGLQLRPPPPRSKLRPPAA